MKDNRSATAEKLAYANPITLDTLIRVLEKKGVLTQKEVVERVKVARKEMAQHN